MQYCKFVIREQAYIRQYPAYQVKVETFLNSSISKILNRDKGTVFLLRIGSI